MENRKMTVSESQRIIEEISNIVQVTLNVLIFEKVYPYDSKRFIKILKSEYTKKRKHLIMGNKI